MAIHDKEQVFHTVLRELLNTIKNKDGIKNGVQQNWLLAATITAFRDIIIGVTHINTTTNMLNRTLLETPSDFYRGVLDEVSRSMVAEGSSGIYSMMAIDAMEWLLKFDMEGHFSKVVAQHACVEAIQRLVVSLYFVNNFFLDGQFRLASINPFDGELESGRCVLYTLSIANKG